MGGSYLNRRKGFVFGLTVFITLIVISVTGCKKFAPPATAQDYPFKDRIRSETQANITVSVGVPSKEETEQIFHADLYKKGIQPVWIKIENKTDLKIGLMITSLDQEYFSPNETAYKTRLGYSKMDQLEREGLFEKMDFYPIVPPHGVESGFIFTHLDEGSKFLNVDIMTEDKSLKRALKRFTYLIQVPGLKVDYYEVDFKSLYKPEEITDLTLEELRKELADFPCCTFSKKGEMNGDPINLVVIGKGEDALSAFVRSGWRETETQKGRAWKTLKAYFHHRPYDYAPMSMLWLFERGQDAGFQKPRETPHERNHFRLWLTPWTYKGQPVWIGAISRDIGLRYTFKSPYFFTTHKIDSDVDESREYLLEDLISVNSVKKVGWVKGVGEVPIEKPKLNPMNDLWYSDGLRIVLFLSPTPVDLDDVEVLKWEFPPERSAGPIEPLPQK